MLFHWPDRFQLPDVQALKVGRGKPTDAVTVGPGGVDTGSKVQATVRCWRDSNRYIAPMHQIVTDCMPPMEWSSVAMS